MCLCINNISEMSVYLIASADCTGYRPFHCSHTPLQIIHIVGNFLRIWSVYSMYRYLSHTGASVVLFIFTCVVPSAFVFLVLQKPWKGRPLSNSQVSLLCFSYNSYKYNSDCGLMIVFFFFR